MNMWKPIKKNIIVFDKVLGGLAQLGEHLPCKQGVTSSNLVISIGFNKSNLGESLASEGSNE